MSEKDNIAKERTIIQFKLMVKTFFYLDCTNYILIKKLDEVKYFYWHPAALQTVRNFEKMRQLSLASRHSNGLTTVTFFVGTMEQEILKLCFGGKKMK